MSLGVWIKKASPIILACLGAAGTVLTAVLAAKAAPKAQALKERMQKDRLYEAINDESLDMKEHQEPTMVDIVKAEAPAYIPAAAAGIGTILCILGASALNFRQQASLASAYALAQNTFSRYKGKVKSIIGSEADIAAEKALEQEDLDIEEDQPPWDELQTFYLEHYGRFFERTMEQVQQAEYHINRNFVLRGSATFNEFLEFLDLEPIKEGDSIGWFDYIGEVHYGYRWIDFRHRRYTTDDGMTVCAIDMLFPPHTDDEEDDSLSAEITESVMETDFEGGI